MKTDNTKGNRWSTRGTIYAEWVREESKYERKKNIKRKEEIQIEEENITRVKKTVEKWKQLKVQGMQRYEKRIKLYRLNFTFKNYAKIFYREIGKEKVTVKKMPATNDIGRFLDTIWSEEKKLWWENKVDKECINWQCEHTKSNNGVTSVSKNCKQR